MKLEVDGKLMTGRDVAVACALGAEEFGFATAPLVALGCLMLRACNLDTCVCRHCHPRPCSAPGFSGEGGVCHGLYDLFGPGGSGRSWPGWACTPLEELVGRRDLLRVVETPGGPDVSPLLAPAQAPEGSPTRFRPKDRYPFHLEDTLDHRLLFASPGGEGPGGGGPHLPGPGLWHHAGLGGDPPFRGTACRRTPTGWPAGEVRDSPSGPSCRQGVTLNSRGDANDYFGKGLSGGKLIAYPPADSAPTPGDQVIVGNVALYGATGGKAFLRGHRRGTVLCAQLRCPGGGGGRGDHGCEYMTGGRVAVIGPTGRNFAAGMSGGVVYVLDRDHDFYRRVNKDLVSGGAPGGPGGHPGTSGNDCPTLGGHWLPPGPGDPGAG